MIHRKRKPTICVRTRNMGFLDKPASPYAHVAERSGLVCLAGQVAADGRAGRRAVGDIAKETRAVMASIGRTLKAEGLGFADVVRVDIHLTDLGDMKTVDRVYARHFARGRFPARTCVEVRRLYGGCRIEVTVMARRKETR